MGVYKRGHGSIYYMDFKIGGQRYQESTHEKNEARARDVERDRRAELREEFRDRCKRARRLGCEPEDLDRCPECEALFDGKSSIQSVDGAKLCSEMCRQKRQSRLSPVPTLGEFLKQRFLPWAETTFAAKPKTWRYYRHGARRLGEYLPLASCKLDEVNGEKVSGYIAKRQADGIKVSAVNREIQVLRRSGRLAVEWGVIKSSPKVKMLPGENRRERVILPEEEARYLAAAEEPLASIATVLVDSGFRPEECFRLKWESITWVNGRHGTMLCTHGKTKAARRTIPMTARVRAVLESRWKDAKEPDHGWIWPAPTKSGHIEPSSLRKLHGKAFQVIIDEAAKNNLKPVRPFVLYDLRHTFLTRLGGSGCDVWTLARIAGHSSITMSARYVHSSDDQAFAAVERLSAAPLLLQ